ncbi:angio-associated migratory cell protein [Toxorhynchites rutilus septentrionalis]|uniref:angio-associated migratory cell protein n=1 Tax=Toxorhynchites rutilus septentrionalis TaxID=329112 RepID=UPI00247A8E58|nr:angio-associated migratory cell protein [Toxorhynchites rutilus septentrionalis]
MRENTPPRSPYSLNDDDGDDDELIYVGDADEVLDQWMAEEEADMGEEEAGIADDEDEPEDVYIPERDDAKLTFSKHTGPVFCVALHPTENIAITGGEDDKAYVWNTETGETIFEVTGHTDSVIACEFSYDGVYVATGDMAGMIQIFKTTQEYKKVWDFTMGDMCWMRWHFGAHVMLAGGDTGEIYVWRIPSGDCKVLQGFGEKCEVARLSHDGKRIAAGYGNGAFKIWDIKSNAATLEVAPNEATGHNSNITCMSIDRESQLIITGSEGGSVLIIGPSGPVGQLSSDKGPIESVLIDCPQFEVKVAATGTLSGKVTIWDIARQVARVECEDNHRTGITKMLWGKDCTLIAGTLGGVIKVWDVRSGALKCDLLGHRNDIHDLFYDSKKNILLSSSEDGTAKIFQLS